MITTIAKWGNSLGVRIPRGVLEDAGIAEGSEVDVRVEDGRIVLHPRQTPTIAQLIERITPDNRHAPQLPDTSVGREAW